ncbi:hypothetical protein PAPYR_1881 [Paratrimastix pyriformis]|uniref:Uncharacterized protein n=1 Tax=Paratrimastix pyriformis TaxID=342808 RepID=A0ABQ8URI8_9EUKA|nr:hypothetical protein PAPYR_1881 [Paratrimastix pyriformis]
MMFKSILFLLPGLFLLGTCLDPVLVFVPVASASRYTDAVAQLEKALSSYQLTLQVFTESSDRGSFGTLFQASQRPHFSALVHVGGIARSRLKSDQIALLTSLIQTYQLPFFSVLATPDRSIGLRSSYVRGGPSSITFDVESLRTFWPSIPAMANDSCATLPAGSTTQQMTVAMGDLDVEPAVPITAYDTQTRIMPIAYVHGSGWATGEGEPSESAAGDVPVAAAIVRHLADGPSWDEFTVRPPSPRATLPGSILTSLSTESPASWALTTAAVQWLQARLARSLQASAAPPAPLTSHRLRVLLVDATPATGADLGGLATGLLSVTNALEGAGVGYTLLDGGTASRRSAATKGSSNTLLAIEEALIAQKQPVGEPPLLLGGTPYALATPYAAVVVLGTGLAASQVSPATPGPPRPLGRPGWRHWVSQPSLPCLGPSPVPRGAWAQAELVELCLRANVRLVLLEGPLVAQPPSLVGPSATQGASAAAEERQPLPRVVSLWDAVAHRTRAAFGGLKEPTGWLQVFYGAEVACPGLQLGAAVRVPTAQVAGKLLKIPAAWLDPLYWRRVPLETIGPTQLVPLLVRTTEVAAQQPRLPVATDAFQAAGDPNLSVDEVAVAVHAAAWLEGPNVLHVGVGLAPGHLPAAMTNRVWLAWAMNGLALVSPQPSLATLTYGLLESHHVLNTTTVHMAAAATAAATTTSRGADLCPLVSYLGTHDPASTYHYRLQPADLVALARTADEVGALHQMALRPEVGVGIGSIARTAEAMRGRLSSGTVTTLTGANGTAPRWVLRPPTPTGEGAPGSTAKEEAAPDWAMLAEWAQADELLAQARALRQRFAWSLHTELTPSALGAEDLQTFDSLVLTNTTSPVLPVLPLPAALQQHLALLCVPNPTAAPSASAAASGSGSAAAHPASSGAGSLYSPAMVPVFPPSCSTPAECVLATLLAGQNTPTLKSSAGHPAAAPASSGGAPAVSSQAAAAPTNATLLQRASSACREALASFREALLDTLLGSCPDEAADCRAGRAAITTERVEALATQTYQAALVDLVDTAAALLLEPDLHGYLAGGAEDILAAIAAPTPSRASEARPAFLFPASQLRQWAAPGGTPVGNSSLYRDFVMGLAGRLGSLFTVAPQSRSTMDQCLLGPATPAGPEPEVGLPPGDPLAGVWTRQRPACPAGSPLARRELPLYGVALQEMQGASRSWLSLMRAAATAAPSTPSALEASLGLLNKPLVGWWGPGTGSTAASGAATVAATGPSYNSESSSYGASGSTTGYASPLVTTGRTSRADLRRTLAELESQWDAEMDAVLLQHGVTVGTVAGSGTTSTTPATSAAPATSPDGSAVAAPTAAPVAVTTVALAGGQDTFLAVHA